MILFIKYNNNKIIYNNIGVLNIINIWKWIIILLIS